MGVSRTCYLHILLSLLVLCCGRAAYSDSHVKHQYIAPAPEVLPSPLVEPAPLVLPAGAVEPAGAIAPAGLISPAPLIAPAPAILPADAIKEKNRAYPSPEEKRNGIPFGNYGTQSTDSVFDTNQYPSQYSNQGNLVSYGDFNKEQYDFSHTGSASEQRESLNYFDPGLETQTGVDSSTKYKSSLGPDYSDIIKDENDLTTSLMREIDQEGSAIASASFDNLESGSERQALSEGLVTAQRLSANELMNKPLTTQTSPTANGHGPPQNFTRQQVDNTSPSSRSAQSGLFGNFSSSASRVSNVTNKLVDTPSTVPPSSSSSSLSSDPQNASSWSSPSSLPSPLSSSSPVSSSSSSSPSSSPSSSSSSSPSSSPSPSAPAAAAAVSGSSRSSLAPSSSSSALSKSSSSSPSTTSSSLLKSNASSSSSLSVDTSLPSLESEAPEHSHISSPYFSNIASSASLTYSKQTPSIDAGNDMSQVHLRTDDIMNSEASNGRTGDKKNLEPSVTTWLSTHETPDAAADRKTASLSKSEQQASTGEDGQEVKQVSQDALGNTDIPSTLAASTINQHDSLSSVITASEQRLKSSNVNNTLLPVVGAAKTPHRSPCASLPALTDSKTKPAKAESEYRPLKDAGANLVPSKLYAPCDIGLLHDLNRAKTSPAAVAAPPPKPTLSPRPANKAVPLVLPTQTQQIRVLPSKNPAEQGKDENGIPQVHPTQSGYIPQSNQSAGSHASYSMVDYPPENRLDEAKLLGMLAKETITKYVQQSPRNNGQTTAEKANYKDASNATGRIRTDVFTSDTAQENGLERLGKASYVTGEKTAMSSLDLESLTRQYLLALSKKSSTYVRHPNLVSKRSVAGHVRTRRQLLVPVLPLDNSASPLAAPILTPQLSMFGPTQPVFPVLSQVQQPFQPDVSPQSFFASPSDQALPMSPMFTQPALAPMANPMSPVQPIMQFLPQRNEIAPQPLPQAFPQPLPQSLPQPFSQSLSQPQQFLAPMGSPSQSYDAPLPSSAKFPSMMAATQAYRDLQDINTKSHMLDEVMKDIGGDERYGNDANKYEYANQEDAWSNPDTNIYNGKRRNSELSERDFDFSNGDSENLGTEPFRKRLRAHDYDDRGRYRENEDGDYEWRPRKAWNRPARKFTMADGREEYENARDSDIVGRRLHPADDTTENAIKESSPDRKGTRGRQSDEADTSYDSDQVVTSPSNSYSQETDSEEDSEESKQREAADKKVDPHSDLKDDTEEEETAVVTKKVAGSPAHASVQSKATKKSGTNHILERLNSDSVMHLDFNKPPQSRKNMADDQSGNGNDADLANGATISTRNFGTCGHGVDLNKGEIVYHSKSFIRKPTKAVSITMWVKSRKPGLVRWFDFSDGAKAGKSGGGKPVTVPKNRWTHLAGTFETKTGVSRVYVNGDLLSERVGKIEKELPQDFTATGLGHKFGDEFVAFLDDLYMFDRVISPEEVKVLYKKCEFNRMVLHFGFQQVNMSLHTLQLQDQSGLENDATITGGAHIMTTGCDKCGACLDASSGERPGVYMDGKIFNRKPTSGVTIAAWISLNKTKGLHSILQALDDKDEKTSIYNMEVVDGHLHWRHQSRGNSEPAFDVTTEDVVVPENMWIHVGATYNSTSGTAEIYVNGIKKAHYTNSKKPKLCSSWGKMAIGGHFQDNSPFVGLLDEVFVYNWALDSSELHFVMKYCADHPKLVAFTVRVPIYKRRKIQRHY